ncbi:MAG: autotransporter outer membrane beta-barrel domain-containing protein [Rhodospirillales bacterium]|nr:autotransporter outer membrane beta-barrel domain-containing protein [Rhodospirillales bacterium]
MKTINKLFTQNPSDLAPVIRQKSFSRKIILPLALTTLSLPFANAAHAARSAGCAAAELNTTSTNTGTVLTTDRAFFKGEKITIKLTENSGTRTITSVSYNDNDNNANNLGGADGSSIASGGSKTFTFTVPADTTGANISINLDDDAIIARSCIAAPATAESSGTKSAVVSAVSRSQTTVIQQNISSRASTVSGSVSNAVPTGVTSAGTGAGTGTSAGAGAGAGLPNENTNFSNTRYTANAITDRDDAMRRLAMTGNFDSSLMAANGFGASALALGPTDQGDIGGAGGIDGRSALQNTSPFTVWGHGSFTSVENDFVSGTNDSRYDGDVWGYNIGLDYKFAETLTAGLSLGYNDTDLTTSFNDGTYREKGWMASPYAIYRPIANLTVVGEAGFGIGDIDVMRSNDTISGDTDSSMWFAAVNASYVIRPVETLPVSLSPSVSLMAARKTVDSYTESDGTAVGKTTSNTRQINPSIEAAYDFAASQTLNITPFVETGLVYDFTDEINNDKTAFNIGGGIRLSDAISGLNAALEGSYLAGRSDYSEYTLSGTVTYGFVLMDDDGQEMGIVKPFIACNLNEYGNQRVRTGFGFDTGPLTSELALSHMMSIANDEDDTDSSMIEISMSLPF